MALDWPLYNTYCLHSFVAVAVVDDSELPCRVEALCVVVVDEAGDNGGKAC